VGREKTEERERQAFELFRKDFQLPEGRIQYGDKPDVVIDGPRRIGIEITDLYLLDGKNPDSEQVQQRRRTAVLERAQAIYHEVGGRRIELVIGFSFTNPIREIAPLAEAIAQLGQRLAQSTHREVPRGLFDHIPELTSIYCIGREYADARWRPNQLYGVSRLLVPRVEAVIAEKTVKAAGYLPCECYWLLIVVDFMNPAQDQDIRWPADAPVVEQHVFERIFLYKSAFHEVIEVPI
jgi:hypothetical protein